MFFCRGQALFFLAYSLKSLGYTFLPGTGTGCHAVKEELRQFSRPLRGIGAVHFAFR